MIINEFLLKIFQIFSEHKIYSLNKIKSPSMHKSVNFTIYANNTQLYFSDLTNTFIQTIQISSLVKKQQNRVKQLIEKL